MPGGEHWKCATAAEANDLRDSLVANKAVRPLDEQWCELHLGLEAFNDDSQAYSEEFATYR